MRINFLLPHLKISGGVKICLCYADYLARRGHEVKVIVVSPKTWRRNLANWMRIKIRWYRNFTAEVIRITSMDSVNIPDADIVVASYWRGGIHFLNYPKSKGLQYQFIMHDERLYHGEKNEVANVYLHSSKKIVISTWLKKLVKESFYQDSDLFLTPVDFSLFHKEKINRTDNDIRVLMLHHSYEWKGVKEGLQAFEDAKKEIKNLKLILFGVASQTPDVPYDEYYYNIKQTKLAQLYSGCDIFLCPSWYEGLGMPAMEAMACGSAVVTFDTGGSRDYAIDGQTSFVAKNTDVQELTRKLILAAKKNSLRYKIAEEGYRFIHEDIETWEESTKRLEKLFLDDLNK